MNYLSELIKGKSVTVKDKAYAKINLYLDVTDKRDDGYHEIKSYMHSVSLCDDVTVEVKISKNTSVSLSVSGNDELPADETNLAYRAAVAYTEWTHASLDIKIKLEKRIPISAGLAGGSSDAAAVLRCLNVAMNNMLPVNELAIIAGGLGSDVPYCLVGGTKLCEGRGEIMFDTEVHGKMFFVIAKSDGKISTKLEYSKLDGMYHDFKNVFNVEGEMKFSMLTPALKSGNLDDIGLNLYNIFESVVLPDCNEASKLKAIMFEEGAVGALMSGSGPSVFGIFRTGEEAERVAEKLGEIAYYAESVI